LEKEPYKNIHISVSQTGGLTSIQQLVDTTPNEIFSFRDITSETEENIFNFPPFYEEGKLILGKSKRNILKEYKSIVKNKLRKPIDLKKLYYEQFEHDLS